MYCSFVLRALFSKNVEPSCKFSSAVFGAPLRARNCCAVLSELLNVTACHKEPDRGQEMSPGFGARQHKNIIYG